MSVSSCMTWSSLDFLFTVLWNYCSLCWSRSDWRSCNGGDPSEFMPCLLSYKKELWKCCTAYLQCLTKVSLLYEIQQFPPVCLLTFKWPGWSIPYSPTNAHSQFIKTIKIIEYYSNMFRFTQKPSSGSQSVLAKITYVVHWLHNWSCGRRQCMAA